MRRLALLVVVGGLIAGLAAGATLAAASGQRLRRAHVRPAPSHGLITVLAVGSDIGRPYRPGNPLAGRADAIHLIAVAPRARRATIVSIPRDALIGGTKVNSHLARGGPRRLVAVLRQYTGVRIDHWAVTSFRGLERMVAELGGLPIRVTHRLRDAAAKSDLQRGRTRLSGTQALAFARDRKSLPDGDFGRVRNQGRLLRAALAEIRRGRGQLPRLVRLVASFGRWTETDMSPRTVLSLALLATRIRPQDVRLDALRGNFATGAGGASLVILRPGDAFARLRKGRVGP